MRKTILSALIVLLVAGLVGAGTFAYFRDTETSSGNTFFAGTLDLKVSDGNEGFGDGVSTTWTMSNMVPGVTIVSPFNVYLQNSGTVAGNHVEISFNHSINDAIDVDVESDTNPNSIPGEMARWIEITSMTYGDGIFTNILNSLTDANGNNFIDLEDVTLSPNTDVGGPLDNLLPPPPNSGGTSYFQMALKFNSGATNDIQGDILTTTVTFVLNQDASQ